ncbi:unnamed protein product [marine sediment metagenome]|uniref:Uncharacterized protein n=1 Tax=marine sediment metagenome TaxID=412755 RepID=X0VE12_9ZZZZ
MPIRPNDPAVPANREACKVLSKFAKPFLVAFSDGEREESRGLRTSYVKKYKAYTAYNLNMPGCMFHA